jgi:AraC-like DNA-binding protein
MGLAYAQIENGRQSWSTGHRVPLHRHDQAYVAVVLSGSYEECGSRGRLRVGPGDVLLHTAFDAHLNRFRQKGAQILNLVGAGPAPSFGLGRVADPDAIARAAERDPIEAGVRLHEQLRESECPPEDWPDILARDLLSNPGYCLKHWAGQHGLAAETISRGFRKVFGITPASFRAEVRARRAFALIVCSDTPLVSIAAAAGFADQAHMSRATRALTGLPPTAWRRSNSFKTHPANIV